MLPLSFIEVVGRWSAPRVRRGGAALSCQWRRAAGCATFLSRSRCLTAATLAGTPARACHTISSSLRHLRASISSSPSRRQRVFSGVQPTGALHLGNYLGAIRQWVTHQDLFENWFCVVDLHAITVPHDAQRLAEDTMNTAAMYLACGIDPRRCKIFVQSHVPAHAEMAWLLNCLTPMSWLEKMTQFKDKRAKLEDAQSIYVGLFTYPVLMAADILLYRAERVPVGEDQRQHLELARDVARSFNHLYGKRIKRQRQPPVFREPEALAWDESSGVARVMSLTDGTSKMSKSAASDMSRINLLDDADTVRSKIKRCKTDAGRELVFDDPDRPECTNLLNVYRALTGSRPKAEIEDVLRQSGGWAAFKPLLAEAIVTELAPIQRRYREVLADRGELQRILRDGAEAAAEIANETLRRARGAMGFMERVPGAEEARSVGASGVRTPRPEESAV